jgi:hypothetical protein
MGSWIFNEQNGCAVNLELYSSIRWFRDDLVIEFCRRDVRDYPSDKPPEFPGDKTPDATGLHVDCVEWGFQSEEDFDRTLTDLLRYLEAARVGAD